MENSSFEKEIRRRVANLHLEPSEKIWPEIENQIQKKNRPIPMILLIFFLVFLAGAAGYLILNRNFSPAKEKIPTSQISQSSPSHTQKENSFSPVEKDSTVNKVLQDSPEKSLEKTSESLIVQVIPHSEKRKENSFPVLPLSDLIEKNATPDNLPHHPTADRAKPIDIDWLPAKSIEKSFLYPRFDPNISKNKITLPRNIKTPVISRNLDFSIAVTGGSAWLLPSLMDMGSPSDPPVQNSPDTNPNPDPGSPTVFPPLQPKPISSYSIHVMIKKPISSRTRISLEPGYRQWNIRQNTGQKMHSPDGDYYLSHPVGTNIHKSKFHFLELPVSLETQLHQGSSPALFWHGGIHFSRLLGSNALQFDYENAHYIPDKSSLAPWQAGLNTGLDFLIFAQKDIPLKIGPYFYYNLSKISKEGLYKGKHLSSAGLKIEFLLSKK